MSNKAWPLKIFLREVSKLFKCWVLYKNFDRKTTKTTSKYIAGLQDLFKDKDMNGKSNYKLKSL